MTDLSCKIQFIKIFFVYVYSISQYVGSVFNYSKFDKILKYTTIHLFALKPACHV